jgi:dynein light chain Tctex-type 1
VDEVSDIIKDSIEHSIGSQLYQQNMVNKWTNSVVENCLTRLCKLAKPFKYIGKTVLSIVSVTYFKFYHDFAFLTNY